MVLVEVERNEARARLLRGRRFVARILDRRRRCDGPHRRRDARAPLRTPHLLSNPVVCNDEIGSAKIRDRHTELVGHDSFETDGARDRAGIGGKRSVDCGWRGSWLLLAGVAVKLRAERTKGAQNRSNDS
jgi:hypothetical protein